MSAKEISNWKMPHLGQRVDELIYQKYHTRASIGKLIGKNVNTVYGYVSEPSLHARILWDLSMALNYDFFEYLSNSLNLNGNSDNKAIEAQNRLTKTEQITRLEQQVKDLEKEVAIYKSIIQK